MLIGGVVDTNDVVVENAVVVDGIVVVETTVIAKKKYIYKHFIVKCPLLIQLSNTYVKIHVAWHAKMV